MCQITLIKPEPASNGGFFGGKILFMKGYWLGMVIAVILFAGVLMWHKQAFSNQKLLEMINTPTKLKGMTDNYCLYQTALDPKEPNELAVKVTFVCGGRQALNTISWTTVTQPTLAGIIEQIARINGMNYPKMGLYCKIDGRIVADDSGVLSPGNQVVCQVPI